MHERTRRNLCRLAFLALVVLPTLATLTWTAYRASPLYSRLLREQWEQQLFAWTGLEARLDRVDAPAGGPLVLHRLQLFDPDGGSAVGTIRQVEIARHPQGIVVLLSQPEIAAGKFLRLWEVMNQRVLHGPVPSTAIQLTSGEVTLEVGRQPQTFTTVRCTVEPFETNVRAWLEFQLAGVSMSGPAHVRIERHRQALQAMTTWTLHSDTPLPCAVFRDYLPQLAQLGDRAMFQGTVTCGIHHDSWSSDIVGRLLKVDLSQVTADLPHRLSGDATVTLDRMIIQQGRIHSASGTVISPGGTVSRSFVSALAEYVPLQAPEVMLAATADLTAYDRLAFRFSVAADGFSLAGLDPGAGDVLLTAGGEALLTGNWEQRYPLVALVRALDPESLHQVPATEATQPLLQLLTFPSHQRAAPAAGDSRSPRLRLTERPN